jgi:tetratricopeptide (TPR) repeat protein
MSANRLLRRSLGIAVAVAPLMVPLAAAADEAQQEAQKRFEAGQYQQVLDVASENRDDPASTFMAGYAASRMDNLDRAREEFSRLAQDSVWQLIGKSAQALVDGNLDDAWRHAEEAVASGGDNPYAQYQLGMVASRRGDHERAAQAFARAAELKSDFAYAHYYAGLEYHRLRQGGTAGEHLGRFLELAPNAPEHSAIVSLMRTLRG